MACKTCGTVWTAPLTTCPTCTKAQALRENKRYCAKCGTVWPQRGALCPTCLTPYICPRCGYHISDFDTDCPKCRRLGPTAPLPSVAPLVRTPPPPPVPPQPQIRQTYDLRLQQREEVALGQSSFPGGTITISTVVGPKLSPEENLELAKRQLVTAIEEKDFFKQHLALNSVAELAYRNRENSKDDYDLAIECWETQVAIAEEMMLYLKNSHIQSCINSKTERRFHAPSHPGFERLSIVAAKEGRFKDAIKLCKTAKNQGWNGDWDKRIARYEAQEAKQAKAHGKAQTRTRAE